eukprot:2600125-Rhodomonas_salina.1
MYHAPVDYGSDQGLCAYVPPRVPSGEPREFHTIPGTDVAYAAPFPCDVRFFAVRCWVLALRMLRSQLSAHVPAMRCPVLTSFMLPGHYCETVCCRWQTFAMSGTHRANAGFRTFRTSRAWGCSTSLAIPGVFQHRIGMRCCGTDVPAISLQGRYGMPGTGIAYAAKPAISPDGLL